MSVAPFLSEHIPTQYNPIGQPRSHSLLAQNEEEKKLSTKFCYRHRPDLKCRRQANEPSMEQLQDEMSGLSQSDQQAISHVWSLFSAAPAKHRNLMLQGILTQCCFPQLSFISANVRDLIKIDFLSALPPELGFKILCYLDTTSLCKAAQVSQRWRSLADDDVVWHKMCEQHIDRKCTKCGWGLPLLERKRLRIEKRQIQLRATGRGLNQWSPDITPIPEEAPSATMPPPPPVEEGEAGGSRGTKRSFETTPVSPEVSKRHCSTSSQESSESYFAARSNKRPWKDVYKDRFKVGTAWKYGRCSTKVFKGHTNGVMCLQFDDNVLITGSYDTTVKVWDINTGEELRTLYGHTSGIRALQFDDKKLMTGSLDSTMRMWNWKTGELLRTFPAHQDGIITLHFTEGYVATGSRDRTVRVWNNTSKATFVLRGHTDWVNCVKIDQASRTLFSASDDLTIRLWDLDTRECIRVFAGHVGQVQQVVPMPIEFELDDHALTPGDKDDDASSVSSVTIAPSHQEQRLSTSDAVEPFWPNDAHRPAPPRYMLTGALDSTIRLWDTHFRPTKTREPTPQPESNSEFDMLPTDPLTNSHTPRAQACVRTFFGHVEGIWALSADHLRLISGSEDRMLKIWDPRTGKCERTFTGHQGPVTCAGLSDSRVASGSEDCEVRMLCFGEVS
ncbi:putative E3 ubiquitin ligase complex SCF subunit sconB [Pseudocercospora fuligena]|uniref:Putative E3 ubiquitin ligase complex SCF subunit sconB n=1 Tax=Pseudocercospora fuligena TaxID=685502 RepID=A0A8H6RL98_9PEZI|nr:putative E3 ubiquitin ligase complex SCF subunit sconB [Pseudocercospora fuligena]